MGVVNFIGRIGKVINHEINKAVEIIGETRKGYNQKAILYNASGDDSPPVKNDKIVFLKIDGTGKCVVIGTFTESQGAKPGEKIFFARDENGAIKSKLSMLGNGGILLEAEKDYSQNIKGKYFIGNNSTNMQKLLLDLVDEIKNIMTFGPPPQHKIHPSTITSLEAYKNKIKDLLKESV